MTSKIIRHRQHRYLRFNDEFFKNRLTAEEYYILRQKGTEAPFSGKYLYFDAVGVYHCRACGQRLFLSCHKFHSYTGWPSFNEGIKGALKIRPDFSHFMIRREVLCHRCGSHLGHLFFDMAGLAGIRYCINSTALEFKKRR